MSELQKIALQVAHNQLNEIYDKLTQLRETSDLRPDETRKLITIQERTSETGNILRAILAEGK
jgi:hypothetical protein